MDISADAGFVMCWGLERLVMTEGNGEKVSLEKGWDMPLVAFGLCVGESFLGSGCSLQDPSQMRQ